MRERAGRAGTAARDDSSRSHARDRRFLQKEKQERRGLCVEEADVTQREEELEARRVA